MPGEPQVDDPGEYNQRLRLKEIADARQDARAAISSVQELRANPGLNAEKVVLGQVQALAAELEWLIRDRGEEEYFQRPLGTVSIPAPDAEDLGSSGRVDRLLGPEPEPEQIEVRGLFSTESTGIGYAGLSETVSHTWEKTAEIRHSGPQELVVTKSTPVPLSVSRAANRLCRKFIFKAGLDARIEDESDEDANPI